MRNLRFLVVCSSVVAAFATIAACTPYDPSLPAQPFSCGSADPKCPDGYTCMLDGTSGRNLCEQMAGTGPDAAAESCADDHSVEPNDTPATAYSLSPLPQNPFTLAGLAICPATDVDDYAVTVSDQQNLDVTMTYDPGGAVLTMSVLNSSGVAIEACPSADCTTTGRIVEIKLANLATGTYLVHIVGPGTPAGAGSGENNYKLTVGITN